MRIFLIILFFLSNSFIFSQIYIVSYQNSNCGVGGFNLNNSSVNIVVYGGQPASTPGTYYNYTNTGAGTLETTGNVGNYGILTITGLDGGQTYSVSVSDGLGNTATHSGVFIECPCPTIDYTGLPNTMSCSDMEVTLRANNAATAGGHIQPGWYGFLTCNTVSNNKINVYRNGSYFACFGPVADGCVQNIDPRAPDPSAVAIYRLVASYLDTTATYRFDLCEGSTTSHNMVIIIQDKVTGKLLTPNNIIWNTKDGICQSVTIGPPPNLHHSGFATFSGSGVTSDNNGYGYFNPQIAGPGVHTIQYLWDNTNSKNRCTGTVTHTVTVTNPYSASISYPKNTYCMNEPNPTPTISGSYGGLFSAPTGVQINSSTGVINLAACTPGGPYKIIYTVGTLPCGDTASFNITIAENPTITVTNNTSICLGKSVNLNATGGTSYTWAPATGLSATNINNPVASPTSTQTYTVTVSNTSGCSSLGSVQVTVNQLTGATAGTDKSICLGQTTAILTASGGISYSWSPATGLNTTSGSTVTANPASNTTYTVTITDNNGCTATDEVQVIVNSLPSANAGSNVTICSGTYTTLNASGGVSYTWSPATGLSATNINNPVASPTTQTIYTVTVTDANGCTNSDNIIVGIYPPLTITAHVSKPSVCVPDTASIKATASGGSGGTFIYSIDGVQSTFPKIVAPTVTTTYTIVATDAQCGTVSAPVTIAVFQLPSLNIIASPDTCQPATIRFSETNTNPDSVTYLWNFKDNQNNLSTLHNPTHEYKRAGSYRVTLQVNRGVCSINSHIDVTVYPLPDAKFTVTPITQTASIFQPIFTFTNISHGATSYTWDFGDNETSTELSPTHRYPGVGNYLVTLSVKSDKGCTDQDTTTVIVKEEPTFWVPTLFTPNKDGTNEIFIPKFSGIDSAGYHMYIYDRWGELIFETSDINQGWDGRVKEANIGENGTYTWLIIYKDILKKTHKKSGAVTLIR